MEVVKRLAELDEEIKNLTETKEELERIGRTHETPIFCDAQDYYFNREYNRVVEKLMKLEKEKEKLLEGSEN